jgi:hypothetical protein
MNKILIPAIIAIALVSIGASYNVFNQPVLINNYLKIGNKLANQSTAQLEVISTTKGSIACPKMTEVQRDAISSPATGLCVFNSTTNKLNTYSGTAWEPSGLIISASAPLSVASGTLSISQANTTTNGYLSSADWNTFNNKEPTVTKGNLTEATSSVLTITGGTGAVIGSGASILVKQSGTTQSGYISSTDWNTFNNKFNSPLTTKGDLLAYDTANARFAIGTQGQILSANTNTGTGLEWIDQPSVSPLTTKGDIYTYSTVNARLAVGTNGQVLSANTTTGTGLAWINPTGGALVLTGSRASPEAISAAGGIAFTGVNSRNLWFVAGDGGPIDITANPQIAAGSSDGQELKIIGTSDANYVTLDHGTGLSMNGSYDLSLDKSIEFVWDGTNWTETNRR